jgi:hypothetical protein
MTVRQNLRLSPLRGSLRSGCTAELLCGPYLALTAGWADCDHPGMPDSIAPRSSRSWLALVSRISAAGLFLAALLIAGQQLTWILVAAAVGLMIVPVAWRRKAAVVPGALFASSADLIPGGPGRAQFPGELSVTASEVSWAPSGYSAGKGFSPLSLAMADCAGITMRRGPALLDVIITVRRRSGGEWAFLTHWRPRLRRAITGLTELIP